MSNKLEHVWLQATKGKDTYKSTDSEWTLDLGAKIERFNNGTIVIHNTIVRGDNYENISTSQREFFETHGWDAGRYNVCLDTFRKRMMLAEAKDQEEGLIIEKIKMFKIKLEEALDVR